MPIFNQFMNPPDVPVNPWLQYHNRKDFDPDPFAEQIAAQAAAQIGPPRPDQAAIMAALNESPQAPAAEFGPPAPSPVEQMHRDFEPVQGVGGVTWLPRNPNVQAGTSFNQLPDEAKRVIQENRSGAPGTFENFANQVLPGGMIETSIQQRLGMLPLPARIALLDQFNKNQLGQQAAENDRIRALAEQQKANLYDRGIQIEFMKEQERYIAAKTAEYAKMGYGQDQIARFIPIWRSEFAAQKRATGADFSGAGGGVVPNGFPPAEGVPEPLGPEAMNAEIESLIRPAAGGKANLDLDTFAGRLGGTSMMDNPQFVQALAQRFSREPNIAGRMKAYLDRQATLGQAGRSVPFFDWMLPSASVRPSPIGELFNTEASQRAKRNRQALITLMQALGQ